MGSRCEVPWVASHQSPVTSHQSEWQEGSPQTLIWKLQVSEPQDFQGSPRGPQKKEMQICPPLNMWWQMRQVGMLYTPPGISMTGGTRSGSSLTLPSPAPSSVPQKQDFTSQVCTKCCL